MIQTDKEGYTEITLKAIEYLESAGYENIRADIADYPQPKGYRKSTKGMEDTNIVPDIVADKHGYQHIFELGLKSAEPRMLKSKWIFLKTLSEMKNYKLGIITTKGHIKFATENAKSVQLDEKKIIRI